MTLDVYAHAAERMAANQWSMFSLVGDSEDSLARGSVVVWVRVAGWMIADGEVPVPSHGDVLEDLGVRFRGEVAPAAPQTAEGIQQLGQDPELSEVTYRATGRASEARDFFFEMDPGARDRGTDFVLAVGPVRYQVQSTVWAGEVPDGARLSVTGRASVIGAYEWDDFGLADVRGDWRVTDVTSGGDEGLMLDLQPTVHDGP